MTSKFFEYGLEPIYVDDNSFYNESLQKELIGFGHYVDNEQDIKFKTLKRVFEHEFLDHKELSKEISYLIEKFKRQEGTWEKWEPDSGHTQLDFYVKKLIVTLIIHTKYLRSKDLVSLIRPSDIILNNLKKGAPYAVYLRKVYDYSIREYKNISIVNTPKEILTYKLEDIDHLFPSRYCIKFKHEVNYKDIFDYSFRKVQDLDITTIRKLRDEMRGNIKKKVNIPLYCDLDNLELAKCKASMKKKTTSSSERSKKPFYKGLLETDELIFRISSVDKAADETRIIAVSDIETRDFLFVTRNATSMINNHKCDKYGSKRWNLEACVKGNEENIFLMADQNKCGWSFPFALMELYFEVLSEEYPEFPHFKKMMEIFRDHKISYEIEGAIHKPTQGFILGMWDNVASFIMSCIFSIFKQEKIDKCVQFERIEIEGFFYGDDQVIREKKDPGRGTFYVWNQWIHFMKLFGLSVNRKKSFVGEIGIFCEIYSDHAKINIYKTFFLFEGCLAFMEGINPFHKKELTIPRIDLFNRFLNYICEKDKIRLQGFYNEVLKPLIKTNIGYEFGIEEERVPYQLGGWTYSTSEDGSTLLHFLRNSHCSDGFLRVALETQKAPEIPMKKSLFHKVKANNLNSWLSLCELDNFDLLGTNFSTNFEKRLKEVAVKRLSSSDYTRFWNEQYEKRRKAFFSKQQVSCQTVINKLFYEKVFKDTAPDLKDLVNDDKKLFLNDLEQKPSKSFYIDPRKALYILDDYTKNGANQTQFYSRENPSIKDLMTNIYSNISRSEYTVRTDWYIWCDVNNININDLFWKYKGINEFIYLYNPPIVLDNKRSRTSFLEDYDFLFWNNELGLIVPYTYDEAGYSLLDDYYIKFLTKKRYGFDENAYEEFSFNSNYKKIYVQDDESESDEESEFDLEEFTKKMMNSNVDINEIDDEYQLTGYEEILSDTEEKEEEEKSLFDLYCEEYIMKDEDFADTHEIDFFALEDIEELDNG